jgi:hypothetical protein
MTKEFNWWIRDPELGKCQISAAIYGSVIKWERQEGRFTSWVPHQPTREDWDRLMAEAETRVPRRLLSPKQFAEIVHLREQALQ